MPGVGSTLPVGPTPVGIQMPMVLNGIELGLMVGLPAALRFAHSFERLLLCWLQHRCVNWTLFQANGSPPRLTGMISSTSALIGCGVFNVLSTGLPHMAHTS